MTAPDQDNKVSRWIGDSPGSFLQVLRPGMPYPKHTCELETNEDVDAHRGKFATSFRNLFLISSSNFRSYLFLRTKGAIEMEMLRQKNSKYWYVVHPFSALRLYWDIFLLCMCFVFALFLAFRSSFLNSFMAGYYYREGRSLNSVLIAAYVDVALTVVFLLDILGFFVTGYYDQDTKETVLKPRDIWKKYLYPDFILDITSSIPVDALIILFSGMKVYANMDHSCFICLQLYNIYRLVRFRRVVSYLCQFSDRNAFSLLFFRIVLAVLLYVLVIHWAVAFSIITPQMTIGNALYEQNNHEILSWIQKYKFMDMKLRDQYLTSLLKEIQNNIGANESAEGLYSEEDYIIALLSNLLGKIYFLFFLMTILEGVIAASALRAKFQMILDKLQIYMKQKDLPVSLKKRMSRFYLYRFQAHYFSNRAMLGRLTESLRKEISMYTCQRLLHNTEVFQSVPKKILTRFVQRMNREMYFPKDVIIQVNTFGECMYFICSGSVAVETVSEREICKLVDGDFFGEIALIAPDRRRTATVKAITITEVYRLEYSDFKNMTEIYPDVYSRLEKYALERYKTTVLVEHQSGPQ